jgi:GNAT superfamily N-acetyltransferase
MSTEVIRILRATNGELVEALLHLGVTPEQLAKAESKWKPARYQAVLDLLGAGTPREQIPEHWHWDWATKVGQAGTIGVRLFGVECEGDWQGLMMTTTIGHEARLAPDAGKPIVYVKYIESAPWNVKSMTASPKFSAVGARLIEAAVRQSIDEGHGGRVGLHSLPNAQRFYEKLWFVNLGLDAAVEDLAYYELTAAASLKILKGGIS